MQFIKQLFTTNLVEFKVHIINEVMGVSPVPAANINNANRFFNTMQLNVPLGLLISTKSFDFSEHNLRLNLPYLYSFIKKNKVGSGKAAVV